MSDLFLRSEGVRGGKITETKKGWIKAKHNDDSINVDNFEGQGHSYKQREEPKIYIQIAGIDYVHTFKSLKKQLDKK